MSNQQQDQELNRHQMIETVRGTSLAQYEDREIVREMTDRLWLLHPDAREMGKPAITLLAQVAVSHGANPLPSSGEIWIWRDKKGNLSIDLGVAYYRRVSGEQDTVLWIEEPRIMTPEEKQEEGLQEGDIGAICRGAYLSKVQELIQTLKINYRDAMELASRTSTGVVLSGEMVYRKSGDPMDAPSGRSWNWVARKRAEKDWYKTNSTFDDHAIQRVREAQGFLRQMDQEIEERQRVRTPEEINRDLYGEDTVPDRFTSSGSEDVSEGQFSEIDPEEEMAQVERVAQDKRYLLESADWDDFARRATEAYHVVIDGPGEVSTLLRTVSDDNLSSLDLEDGYAIVSRYARMVADGVPLKDAILEIRSLYQGQALSEEE